MKEKMTVVRFFLKENTKGGVTVFICLILIPVLMFTGLMIDFARIKLYHAEAASVSASYADAMLSQYDEMLYDVYGLLAVTQDEEAIKALDVIREYMASAYDPSSMGKVTNASKSDLKYLPNNVNFIGMNNAALDSLWSPYGNTKMVLSAVADKKSGAGNSLANNYVFADQVCDYMKIIGPVDLAWNGILSAVEGNEQAKQKKELMNQRKKVDDKYNELDDQLRDLYDEICKVNETDEWDIPNKLIALNDTFKTEFDSICDDIADLAGGKKSNGVTVPNISSKLGVIMRQIKEETEKENGGQLDTWKNDIGTTIQGNSNPTQFEYNYLYQMYCYKEIIGATSKDYLLDHSNYGKLNNWNEKYQILIRINDLKNLMEEYNDISKELTKTDSGVKKDLDEVIKSLRGSSGWGGKKGIGTIAADAERERTNLINMCDNMPQNDMAQGMKDEYSFEAKNYSDPDKQDLDAVDSGNIQFVGAFDYNFLIEKYNSSLNYIDKLNALLEQDKALLEESIDYLTDLESDLVSYIAQQLNYVKQEIKGAQLIWNYDHYRTTNGKTYYLGFNRYSSSLVFKDEDSVKNAIPGSCKWFDIADGKAAKTPENRDYSKFWNILVKWYGEGGSSGKKDAKTKLYKDLLAKIKEIVGKGDAGQSLIDSFSGISIPDTVTCEALSNSEAVEQSISSLFGDDGDFTGNTDTQKSPRDSSYYLTKLLMMDYDWNFFAGATFDKHPEKDSDGKENPADAFQGKSLKGEKITDKTNYLVNTVTPEGESSFLGGAELEFIYWGNRDAQSNLKAVRTQITIIRAVENFASTYSIQEINNAISTIRNALAAVPIAALIVPPLIRAAIAMAETYMDLKALYEGKSIALYKSQIGHMTLLNDPELWSTIEQMFTSEDNLSSPLAKKGDSKDGDDTVMFNYSQFVILCMMLFCSTDTITERTKTLVELNMNYRLNDSDMEKVKSKENIKFRLSNAKVTVTSVCTVDKMNLLVLGGIFKDETVEDYLSGDRTEILKNGFSYTVSRSY